MKKVQVILAIVFVLLSFVLLYVLYVFSQVAAGVTF